MRTLLIIDDEENMRHMLQAMLKRCGYDIASAADGVAASHIIRERTFDFILCDVRMPGMDGLQFLENNRDVLQETTVIMMSAYGSIDLAIAAMKAGAYDFISKPFKSDEVLLTLKKAEEREQLKKENSFLKSRLNIRQDGFRSIVGESSAVKEVIALAEKAAVFDTSILILGESGTGKELFARGIHDVSPRRTKPFFAVNCGSIPAELIESELFGYAKGAFTGAEKDKRGIFEEANGSTLFLDEIGELPLQMQVKLLRVLQEREVRRIGESAVRKIDVRIVAATSRDLQVEITLNRFREDLYYRLNVLTLHLPPLRERIEDVPLLCAHFIEKYRERFFIEASVISQRSFTCLLRHSWPGNVRELENVVQRAMVMADGNELRFDHLEESVLVASDNSTTIDEIGYQGYSIKEAQRRLEEKLIRKALVKCGGNKSRAAVLLDVSYPTLLSKIKEYDI